MTKREEWTSNASFLPAAVGTLAGFAAMQRFPYVCAANGGGAFLVVYFFALITAAVPLFILELAIGRRFQAVSPVALARMNKKWEWMGWFQCFFTLLISTPLFTGASASAAAAIQSFSRLPVVPGYGFATVFTAAVLLLLLMLPLSKGIQRLGLLALLPVAGILVFLVILLPSVPNAAASLTTLFHPDWSRLFTAGTWLAAYSQVFFGVCCSIPVMTAYGKSLPQKSDLVFNSLVVTCGGYGLSIFLSVARFCSANAAAPVSALFNGLCQGLGFLLFLFALAGLLLSVSQAVTDKFPISRTLSALMVTGVAVAASAWEAALPFAGTLAVLLPGTALLCVIACFYETDSLRLHAQRWSAFALEKSWRYLIRGVTLFFLFGAFTGVLSEASAIPPGTDFSPAEAFGWICAALCTIAAMLFTSMKGNARYLDFSRYPLRLISADRRTS